MIAESEVSKMLGKSRFQVSALRRLYLDSRKDWIREKKFGGRKIYWKEEALEKVKTIMAGEATEAGVSTAEQPPSGTGSTPAPASEPVSGVPTSQAPVDTPRKKVLTVSKILINPYYLDAKDQQGQIVRVRIKNKNVWQPNDKLIAFDNGVEIGVLQQIGPTPRHRGDNHYRYQIAQEMGKLTL